MSEYENQVENKERKRKRIFNSVSVVIAIGLFVVAAILVGQLLFDNGVISTNEFYENTSINGVDVSGMNREEAYQLISAKLLSGKDEIQVKLTYGNREWILNGSDFETSDELMPKIEETFI